MEINFPLKASPGRGKLSPQVTDEGAVAGITPHPALCATFPPRGEGFCLRDKLVEAIDIVPFGYADTLRGQAETEENEAYE